MPTRLTPLPEPTSRICAQALLLQLSDPASHGIEAAGARDGALASDVDFGALVLDVCEWTLGRDCVWVAGDDY